MVTENEGLSFGQMLSERYRIISEGRSIDIGMEYQAHDTELERLVVVLVLNRNWDGDEGALERLRGLASWGEPSAPAVLPIKGAGVVDGRLYVLRDHIKGRSLAHLRAEQGALGVEKTLELGIGLCEALAPLHRSGRVHGGLSPHSVFIADDGRVLVTETGLEAALRSRSSQEDLLWGRLPYVSPEQVAGRGLHPSSDVYVIGALMYEMVSNHPVFQGDDPTRLAFQHLSQSPPVLQSVSSDVPLALARVIHKALAKEPSARYRNAGQLAMILRSQVHLVQAQESPEPQRLPRDQSSVSTPILPARPVSALPHAGTTPPYTPPPAPRQVPPIVQSTSMVVSAPQVSSYQELKLPSGADLEQEEPIGADWLMAGLAILALMAVLGLIPLWREVYQRYAIPPDAFSLSQSSRQADRWFRAAEPCDIEALAPDGYYLGESLGTGAPMGRPLSGSVERAKVEGDERWAPGKFRLGSQDYGLVNALHVN